MGANAEELAAAVREIRERVRARYSNNSPLGEVPVPDLMPLVHARDAAEGRVAAIGTVNPRGPGLANAFIQKIKRLIARALDWHVREQIEFNRATMDCVQAAIEALSETNRALVAVAGLPEPRFLALEQTARELRIEADQLRAEVARVLQQFADIQQQFADMRMHWTEWRRGQEDRVSHNEITFLKSLAESHSGFQLRVTTLEASLQELVKTQHSDFSRALATTNLELQKRLWDDLDRVRAQFEALIHRELRVVRQRLVGQTSEPVQPMVRASGPVPDSIDWLRFADRFRGTEEHVRGRQHLYVDRLAGRSNVLDLGCGRGELLDLLREAGIGARGIEANSELVRLCQARGLAATQADIFEYLSKAAEDRDFDGIVATHVVEHLPPARVPELIGLIARRLVPGGTVIIETPNPECLASFALHFYADPTHTHPVPQALLAFYLEEAGIGHIDVIRLNRPDTQDLAGLPDQFRERFFGALDYAIIGRKL